MTEGDVVEGDVIGTFVTGGGISGVVTEDECDGFIGLACGGRCFVRRMSCHDRSRDEVRWRAAEAALDLVRLAALGHPLPDAVEMD